MNALTKIQVNKQKYNGYSNRDTWVVILWLLNDENNYNKLLKLDSGSVDNIKLETLKRHFVYKYEQIQWGNVNLEEVRRVIKETLESIEEKKQWKTLV